MSKLAPFPRLIVAAGVLAVASASAGATTIAHWKFDDGTPGQTAVGVGSVSDSSGNGHDGTPSGGPVYQALAGGGTGLRFDGSNDRVFVPDSADFVTNSMTVEAALSLDTLSATGVLDQIVFRGDSRAGVDPFYLAVYGGKLRWYIQGSTSSADALHSPDPLPVGEMIHVAATIDDATGEMKLYLNGAEIASKTTTERPTVGLLAAWGPGVGIGNLQDSGNQYLDGVIDEIRISDMVLSPDQFLGAVASVPEPVTGALLAIGLLGALRRRRL